jgi:predicted nucleic acid-binding protein
VKVYIVETGHRWMADLCRPKAGNAIFFSQLATVELEVVLHRKALERTISGLDRDKNVALFRRHLRRRYHVMPITDDVVTRARGLIRRAGLPHPLRTYDALHLASAQMVANILAADRRLLSIAHALGLAVDNPEDHP